MQLDALLDRVDQAGGKLVRVGDHRQPPELEAGGAFRGLVRRGLAVELTENRRQTNGWERHALEQLRAGRVEQALAAYEAHDRVHFAPDAAGASVALVRDWWAAGDLDGAVMIVRCRADVRDLNARAREHLRKAGALGSPALELRGGEFAAGDRVVIRRNNLRLGVHNGDRARVLAVDVRRRSIELDCRGRRVALDLGFLIAPRDATERRPRERLIASLEHSEAATLAIDTGRELDR